MKRNILAAGVLAMALLFCGCSKQIELVGYGPPAPLQYGLETRLLNNGQDGALLFVTNRSDDVLSINQSPLAMAILIRCAGKIVRPSYRIMIHMNMNPGADSFVLMAPGQTRKIFVPVSCQGDEYRALDCVYRIKNGKLYDVEMRLNPYFGTFTEETSDGALSRLKIPNYLHKPLRANTMTIRATRTFTSSQKITMEHRQRAKLSAAFQLFIPYNLNLFSLNGKLVCDRNRTRRISPSWTGG